MRHDHTEAQIKTSRVNVRGSICVPGSINLMYTAVTDVSVTLQLKLTVSLRHLLNIVTVVIVKVPPEEPKNVLVLGSLTKYSVSTMIL